MAVSLCNPLTLLLTFNLLSLSFAPIEPLSVTLTHTQHPLSTHNSPPYLILPFIQPPYTSNITTGHRGVTSRPDDLSGSAFWFAIPYRPDTMAECHSTKPSTPTDEGSIGMLTSHTHPFTRFNTLSHTVLYTLTNIA